MISNLIYHNMKESALHLQRRKGTNKSIPILFLLSICKDGLHVWQ